VQKYEQRLNFVNSTYNVTFNGEPADRVKAGFEAIRLLAVTGKRVATCASLYMASLSEADRIEFIKAGTEFETQVSAAQRRQQSNLQKLGN
jgi:hypothetical protein